MADTNVFLFYPNLIGYGRIALAVLSFCFMPTNPWYASITYFASAALDAIDGHVARMFNQGSRFGAMLDQLTDRCAFMALLMALCQFYPSLTFCLQIVAVVDIASHWLHLHATDLTGKNTHKSSTNPILNYYYTSKQFLFFMCFGNEAFYGLLYINAFWSGPSLFGITLMQLLAFLCFPIAFVKSVISLVHLGHIENCILASLIWMFENMWSF
ncbi:CDP-alcohol phosphatidyltransferase domain-containing protein [Ditylenchus destructor]|uniref:CDP-diacylglycerol--inositol 3-phosphatidyltransferase n=1 Tax=Ditylenchus destructor TaxID=166010 RepID=A0AAD4R4K8_9BILA|nr:CDP-alcohol phosphatidyltransferase domain-containing protein [Ditylenchus destructor]